MHEIENRSSYCHICRQTLTSENRCKAHILPRSFYEYFYPDDFGSTIRTIDKDITRIEKIPTGIYDSNILCRDCDGKLGEYDKYFLIFLKGYKRKMIKMPGSKKPIWVVHGFDQQKLKLFILSYAFRASITERREFITFRLKKSDYVKIRNILLDKSGLDKYTIYCAKYSKYDESLILAPKKNPW